ncbi:MAG: hypothetical protein JXA69_15705 [Phycisphaerae bacterium]|nr:hypothetical protein [Phycisphaerae bacterium]
MTEVQHRRRLGPSRSALRWAVAVAAIAAVVVPPTGRAQGASAEDPMDRTFRFIEQTADATEVLNRGNVAEALPLFEALAATYPDLDEDGYVALAVGDCLVALERDDEARLAYEAALASHPDLDKRVESRLTNLALAGNVTDALLAKLRQAVQAGDDRSAGAAWQLAWALEKRSRALLDEAVDAFRLTATDEEAFEPLIQAAKHHANAVEGLVGDLDTLINRIEDMWPSARMRTTLDDLCAQKKAMIGGIEKVRAGWTVRLRGGEQRELQIQHGQGDCDLQVTVDGKPIGLTPAQGASLKLHLDRISAILLETKNEENPTAELHN